MKEFNQQGATLIEILITVLVMGVGLLGIATMQLSGLKYASGAQARTQASLLANDMMDRLRANREIALDQASYLTEGFVSKPASLPKSCNENQCDAVEMAEFDRYAWLQSVENLLPFGQGSITKNDTEGSSSQRIYQISLQWRQVKNEEGNDHEFENELRNFTFRSAL